MWKVTPDRRRIRSIHRVEVFKKYLFNKFFTLLVESHAEIILAVK